VEGSSSVKIKYDKCSVSHRASDKLLFRIVRNGVNKNRRSYLLVNFFRRVSKKKLTQQPLHIYRWTVAPS
jgi:hypothetical protein